MHYSSQFRNQALKDICKKVFFQVIAFTSAGHLVLSSEKDMKEKRD